MSVTVTQYPTTNATHTTGLTNPNNAHADDGVYATCAPNVSTERSTDYGTFGFDALIPANSSITSVKILYEFKVSTTASIASARVAAAVSGTHQGNHDDATEPTADKAVTVDVTADRAWTRADLLDGVFTAHLGGVRGVSATGVTFSFDYIKVEVVFEPPTRCQAYT